MFGTIWVQWRIKRGNSGGQFKSVTRFVLVDPLYYELNHSIGYSTTHARRILLGGCSPPGTIFGQTFQGGLVGFAAVTAKALPRESPEGGA